MFAPTAYRIHFATGEDADTLTRLAEHGSQQPLVGRVLIGQLNGTPAAALSLDDGRVITDPSRHTDELVANLRSQAGAVRAFEATPSLRDRLRAAFAAYKSGPAVAEAPVSSIGDAQHDSDVEHEQVREAA
jgi:hypothetical protein